MPCAVLVADDLSKLLLLLLLMDDTSSPVDVDADHLTPSYSFGLHYLQHLDQLHHLYFIESHGGDLMLLMLLMLSMLS